MALTVDQARECVIREVRARRSVPTIEVVPSLEAAGRILAEPITADRDYPPFARSARDGYAVRVSDLPGELRVIGEVRAGMQFERPVGPGEAVEIMTGAPLPDGADAVVMIEHTERLGHKVRILRLQSPGDNFGALGSETRQN